MKDNRGQILVGVILMLLVLAVIVPAMVIYVQNETRWSVKQARNATAFDLADAGIEKGLRKVSESTVTWQNILNGQAQTGYILDVAYGDVAGGSYAVSISSGPSAQTVTIISVGRESSKNEARAIKAVYSNTGLGATAIRSGGTATMSGTNVQIEWGAVVSNKDLTTASSAPGRQHPQFWSAGNVLPNNTSGSTRPLCDSPNCWQWHSYQTGIPPMPNIDFAAYQAAANATGTSFTGPLTWPGAPCLSDATSCATGNTYYINGDLTINSPGIYVVGNLIVTGNLTLPNGRSGQGGPTVPLPQQAWKQYGNDWAFYKSGAQSACSVSWNDTTPPPASFPGLNSTYLSNPALTVTFSDSKVIVNGFLYVGGNLTAAGGAGQTKVVGAADVVGNVTLGSNNICVFSTDAAAQSLKTTNVVLTRQSWQDYPSQVWPLP